MNLPYILLSITILFCLVNQNKVLMLTAMAISSASAFFYGIVNIIGIFALLIFSLICHIYFNHKGLNRYFKILLFCLICIMMFALSFHMVPGFFNALAIKHMRLSNLSLPFSTYLNFDKAMAGLILYVIGDLYILNKPLNNRSIYLTSKIIALCLITEAIFSILSGFIAFDPKIPDVIWIWTLNNLLFVCMAEEVMCRAFLQNSFKTSLNSKYLHIIISSFIFGLAHLDGGIVYAGLSWIAGAFYGYAYDKTSSILSSMSVHFCLNFSHFILFTYPASIAILN